MGHWRKKPSSITWKGLGHAAAWSIGWITVGMLVGYILTGCGTATPYERGLSTYNSIMNQYRTAYETASITQQADWRATIHPELMTMGKALQTWQKAQNDATAMDAYMEAQELVLQLLMRHGIVVVTEE